MSGVLGFLQFIFIGAAAGLDLGVFLCAGDGDGDADDAEGRKAYTTVKVKTAVEAGLPAAQVQAVLAGEAYADAVRADEQQAARYGITGVPFFVADGKYAVSGAQPPEVLLQFLQRAYDEASRLTPVAVTTGSNSDATCDGDSCAV